MTVQTIGPHTAPDLTHATTSELLNEVIHRFTVRAHPEPRLTEHAVSIGFILGDIGDAERRLIRPSAARPDFDDLPLIELD